VREFGVAEQSARQMSARYRGGPAGAAWLRMPTALPGLAPVVTRRPSLALIMRLPLD
jgi:hypothetical protein